MQFDDNDLDTLLEATGEDVQIILSGLVVNTITGKFRNSYVEASLMDSNVGQLVPVVWVKTSDLAGLTSSHQFIISGITYSWDAKPSELESGLSVIKLIKEG
jgi:hypothetical protein